MGLAAAAARNQWLPFRPGALNVTRPWAVASPQTHHMVGRKVVGTHGRSCSSDSIPRL